MQKTVGVPLSLEELRVLMDVYKTEILVQTYETLEYDDTPPQIEEFLGTDKDMPKNMKKAVILSSIYDSYYITQQELFNLCKVKSEMKPVSVAIGALILTLLEVSVPSLKLAPDLELRLNSVKDSILSKIRAAGFTKNLNQLIDEKLEKTDENDFSDLFRTKKVGLA